MKVSCIEIDPTPQETRLIVMQKDAQDLLDECKIAYEEIKKHEIRFVTFHIDKEKQIAVGLKGDRNVGYDKFSKIIHKGGECR